MKYTNIISRMKRKSESDNISDGDVKRVRNGLSSDDDGEEEESETERPEVNLRIANEIT